MSETTFRHVPGLDGVRGMAVILVFGFHFGFLWRPERNGMLPGGFIGVDVFFVLSGFLITSLLVAEREKRGSTSYRNFYVRRFLRLIPALVVFLAGHFIFTLATGGSWKTEVKAFLPILLYVSNLAQIFWNHQLQRGDLTFTWSLAIEEQFYLVWPALLTLVLLPRFRSRQALMTVILGGAALSAFSRASIELWGSGRPAAVMRTDARLDGLLIGAALALAWKWGWLSKLRVAPAAAVGVIGIIAVALFWPNKDGGLMFLGGYTVVSVATAAAILAVLQGGSRLATIFDWAPLRLAGRVSYGLYLWHVLCLHMTGYYLERFGTTVIAVVGVALTVVAVAASWHFVEQPALRLKKRFEVSNEQPAPAA